MDFEQTLSMCVHMGMIASKQLLFTWSEKQASHETNRHTQNKTSFGKTIGQHEASE